MGTIITFYSYKGGVGRTMALANVAVLLCKWRYRVLIVDWDLEAPGLEFYFKDYLDLDATLRREGIIDILSDFFNADFQSKKLVWKELILKIYFPDNNNYLDFLTAGKRIDQIEYFHKIRELDISKFYSEKDGGYFIELLRQEWIQLYDYVLIDSRTGITDIGGICTIQMPDILVLLFTTIEQSLKGVIDVSEKAELARQKLPFDRLSLMSVPIPSRFDTNVEFKIGQSWLDKFSENLSGIYTSWLPTSVMKRSFLEVTKMPYISYFSFGEKLPVVEQGTLDPTGLGYAYETLSALLANKLEFADLLLENRSDFIRLAQRKKEAVSKSSSRLASVSQRETIIQNNPAEKIEQAIANYQLTLNIYTRENFPQDWAMTQKNLAVAYINRIQGNRAENLEQAIVAYQLALQVYTREAFPEEWATTRNNLANAYSSRIRGERADNLEQAIGACQLALQVYTREAFPEQWAMTQNSLANAYRERIRGERADNLEQAIGACQLALQVYTREAFPEQWATTLNNLANAYSSRIRGERADNLEQAITVYQRALQVYTREAFPEQWAMTQNSLANAYSNRIRGKRADNLEQSITACQRALQVYTREAFPEQWAMTQNSLANAYSNRIREERADNLEQAITAYQLALQIYTHEAFPKECRMTARNLGNLHFEQQCWSEAASAYTLALQAGEILYQSAILIDGKAAELAETNNLPHRATYALARSNNLQAAVLTLEQGHTRGLRENLDRDRADLTQLQQIAPDLYSQYQDIISQLCTLETQERLQMTSEKRHELTPEALRTQALRLREILMQTIDQIRQVPGYASYLTEPSFDDIRQALRPGIPLVYLVPTPAGSLALIVTQDGIDDLWLDDLTETSLLELLSAWFNAYDQSHVNHQIWLDAIDQAIRQLWQPLMAPLIDHLQQRHVQQATLIPTRFLSLLPLHAAWTEAPTTPTGRHYALDAIHFTYAPNARSLLTAQDIAQRTLVDSILAIDNPLNDLPNSTREVTAAVATFGQHKVLQHEQATIKAVLDALPDYNVLHLSCHGTANLLAPLTSGLAMSDGLLTLRDLLSLKLSGVRLAVLSTSETGLVGVQLPDEVMSLAAGLIQVGVAGVIAPLWSPSDLSTMMMLTRFYDFWRIEGLDIDQGLRLAQQWVRDTTNREKAAYFKASLPEFDNVKMLANIASFLYQSVVLSNPRTRDFAHPFYWAAFHYVGV